MRTQGKHSLALDFHENTKILSSTQLYNPRTTYKIYPSAKAIPLDKNNSNMAENDTFLQTLFSRKSTRAFTPENLSLIDLSRLLTLSCGLRNDSEDSFYRTYASAGARYPIEVYVVLFGSGDIEQGIYHYNVKDNSLELIKTGDYTKEIKVFYANQKSAIVTDYPCLILFSVVFNRSMQKYGERGYRFSLIDSGHMSQNLYLAASYLNLGIVGIGAGQESDDRLDEFLGLVPGEENVFYSFAVGYPQD